VISTLQRRLVTNPLLVFPKNNWPYNWEIFCLAPGLCLPARTQPNDHHVHVATSFSIGITGPAVTIKPYSLSSGETYVLQASVGMSFGQPSLVWGNPKGFGQIHIFSWKRSLLLTSLDFLLSPDCPLLSCYHLPSHSCLLLRGAAEGGRVSVTLSCGISCVHRTG
jgi:hypothetical protein